MQVNLKLCTKHEITELKYKTARIVTLQNIPFEILLISHILFRCFCYGHSSNVKECKCINKIPHALSLQNKVISCSEFLAGKMTEGTEVIKYTVTLC